MTPLPTFTPLPTSTGTQPPTLTPTPMPTLTAATIPTFAVSAADSTVTVTLYNATAIQWVQVWIGNADLQEMHLEWYELAVAATCANGICTLPINLNLSAGNYVSYIQPWGEQVGFVQNDIESWLGPITFSSSTAPLADEFNESNSGIAPTSTPAPTATLDPNSLQSPSTQSSPSTANAAAPFSLPDMTGAAEVTVTDTQELISALANANSGGCNAMGTVITLNAGTYQLTQAYVDSSGNEPTYSNGEEYGSHGLPIIKCRIEIRGTGATIERSSSATDEFRIIGVDGYSGSQGSLTLVGITIKNGHASAVGGAGIFNFFGRLYIQNSAIIDNRVDITNSHILGAGIYSFGPEDDATVVYIRSTVISGNQNLGATTQTSTETHGSDGGGIATIGGQIDLEANDIRDNFATRNGGGVWIQNSKPTILIGDNRLIEGGCIVDNFVGTVSNPIANAMYTVVSTNYRASQVWWGTNNLTSINSMVSNPNIIEDPASQAPQDCTSIPSASPQDLATEFFVPLQPTDTSIPVRLSGTNTAGIYPYINYIGNATLPVLCTRDMNAVPPDNTSSHPIVMPEDGTVILIDTNLNADANGLHLNNFGLGRFIAIQIPVSNLDPIVIDALKSSNPNLAALLDNQVGYLHIGFAHLFSVMPEVDEGVEYAQGKVIAESGSSGTNNTHLDVSVYYVSGPSSEYPEALEPEPRLTGLGDSNYQAYFSIYSDLRAIYGITELIDPLTIWPLLEDTIQTTQIDRECRR